MMYQVYILKMDKNGLSEFWSAIAKKEDPELTSTDVPTLHLFLEQFLLKKSWGKTEQLLCNER